MSRVPKLGDTLIVHRPHSGMPSGTVQGTRVIALVYIRAGAGYSPDYNPNSEIVKAEKSRVIVAFPGHEDAYPYLWDLDRFIDPLSPITHPELIEDLKCPAPVGYLDDESRRYALAEESAIRLSDCAKGAIFRFKDSPTFEDTNFLVLSPGGPSVEVQSLASGERLFVSGFDEVEVREKRENKEDRTC